MNRLGEPRSKGLEVGISRMCSANTVYCFSILDSLKVLKNGWSRLHTQVFLLISFRIQHGH